jgi:hypothetical protein
LKHLLLIALIVLELKATDCTQINQIALADTVEKLSSQCEAQGIQFNKSLLNLSLKQSVESTDMMMRCYRYSSVINDKLALDKYILDITKSYSDAFLQRVNQSFDLNTKMGCQMLKMNKGL